MIKLKSKTSASDVSLVDKGAAPRSSSSVNRRRMLGLTVATGVAVAGLAAGKPHTAKAQGWLTLEVKPSFLDIVRTEPAEGDARPTGPFYAEGSLYADGTLDDSGTVPEGAEPVGWWRCWGWSFCLRQRPPDSTGACRGRIRRPAQRRSCCLPVDWPWG